MKIALLIYVAVSLLFGAIAATFEVWGVAMTLTCPKCKSELDIARFATEIPSHPMPARMGYANHKAVEIDGETVVVELRKLCRLSGAKFARVA